MSVGIVDNTPKGPEPHRLSEPWPDVLTWRGALIGLVLAGVVGAITYLGHLFG